MYVTLSMALTTFMNTYASATPRSSLQPSSARRSLPLESPSTTGLRQDGGGGQRVRRGFWGGGGIRHKKQSKTLKSCAINIYRKILNFLPLWPAGVSVKATCTTPWVSLGRWGNSFTTPTSMWRCCQSRWSETTPMSQWGTYTQTHTFLIYSLV